MPSPAASDGTGHSHDPSRVSNPHRLHALIVEGRGTLSRLDRFGHPPPDRRGAQGAYVPTSLEAGSPMRAESWLKGRTREGATIHANLSAMNPDLADTDRVTADKLLISSYFFRPCSITNAFAEPFGRYTKTRRSSCWRRRSVLPHRLPTAVARGGWRSAPRDLPWSSSTRSHDRVHPNEGR